jgi:hypothetical protein
VLASGGGDRPNLLAYAFRSTRCCFTRLAESGRKVAVGVARFRRGNRKAIPSSRSLSRNIDAH